MAVGEQRWNAKQAGRSTQNWLQRTLPAASGTQPPPPEPELLLRLLSLFFCFALLYTPEIPLHNLTALIPKRTGLFCYGGGSLSSFLFFSVLWWFVVAVAFSFYIW